MPKNRTELAAIWPPTSDVAREAAHRPKSPLRAIRAKPGTRAGNFVTRRYRVHPAFADLIAALAGLDPERHGFRMLEDLDHVVAGTEAQHLERALERERAGAAEA
jgi:hypothetical protein